VYDLLSNVLNVQQISQTIYLFKHQPQRARASVTYMPVKLITTRMWATAQPDGRPAEHRWRPLFNAAKFG